LKVHELPVVNPQLLTLLTNAINRNGCDCWGEVAGKRDEGWDERKKAGRRAGNLAIPGPIADCRLLIADC
jgi:hypothetical protein